MEKSDRQAMSAMIRREIEDLQMEADAEDRDLENLDRIQAAIDDLREDLKSLEAGYEIFLA